MTHRLTILGDVDLRAADDAAIGSVLSQPRRFAILLYLALSKGGVHRDRVLAMFWPETSSEKAMTSLRSALHFLRRSLGADVVVRRGDLLELNASVVGCDAAEFEAALESGDAEGALRLYGGELLPGWHADGVSSEFEQWLDEARSRLGRAAAEAAWSLATSQEWAGNAAGAGAWARRALELYGSDEAAARRCIALLGRVGDRAGAVETFLTLERRLRTEYEAEPSPATRAAVEEARAAAGPAPGEAVVATTPPSRDRASRQKSSAVPASVARVARPQARRSLPRRAVSVAATLVLMAAFYSLWGLNRPGAGHAAEPDRRPLLQLEELRDFSPDATAGGLAGALSVELAARLSAVDGIRVRAGAVTAPAGAEGMAAPAYRLRGGVVPSESGMRLTAVLLDAGSGATLDRITIDAPRGDPSADVGALAGRLADDVRRTVGRAAAEHERAVAVGNTRALAMLRSAVADRLAADSLDRARAPEAAVVALDAADEQLARAQIAAPRWTEPSIQRAELAFLRMWINMRPPVADPAAAAADVRDGLAHADRAVRIQRDDPAAHEVRGRLGFWLWRLRAAGSPEADERALARAEADLRRAVDLDPGRARAWEVLSSIFESRGEFAAANHAARRAYRADAYLEKPVEILVRLFVTSLEIGDLSAAEHWCGELERRGAERWLEAHCRLMLLAWDGGPTDLDTDSIERFVAEASSVSPLGRIRRSQLEMIAAVAFARAGLADAARAAIERGRTNDVDPELLKLEAWAQLVLGDDDQAVALLQRAIAHNPRMSAAVLGSGRFTAIRSRVAIGATGE